ncbi:MAG: ABC transporter transmembrane domain-containing protein [Ardenticatenaceae bacterium]
MLKEAIDERLATGEAHSLFISGAIILALAVVRALFSFMQRYYGEWMSHRVAYELRNAFYDKVQRFTLTFHDRTLTGDLMSRATSDISEAPRFVRMGMIWGILLAARRLQARRVTRCHRSRRLFNYGT